MPKGFNRGTAGPAENHDRGNRQDYVGVRLGAELRARAVYAAQQLGIPLSEWLRLAVGAALNYGVNGTDLSAESQGYLHGRALGMRIAQAYAINALGAVSESMPMTFEEANERYPNGEGLISPRTIGNY